MTNADFPAHDRLLGLMLDLTLARSLQSTPCTYTGRAAAVSVAAGGQDQRLALHLHDPHRYRRDEGQRWIEAARRDPRLSLLLHVGDTEAYAHLREARLRGAQVGGDREEGEKKENNRNLKETLSP